MPWTSASGPAACPSRWPTWPNNTAIKPFAVAALVGMLILGVIFMMLSRTLFPYYDTVRELSR
jgi:hypothetical protein